ncbi:MAG: Uncharacterised protein [Polaribacter sp. SA4-10]|nr:MAG: Uncharacterised protein [Polaribacter sp. SA4-10]
MNKLALCFFLVLLSCNVQKNKTIPLSKIEALENEFDFGSITSKDTITHTFKIKNLAKTSLIVNNIATSCGCTTIGKIDSIYSNNEVVDITVQFIANNEQYGKVSNSVVVEMNTEPSFMIFRLKGIVSDGLSN